MLPKGFINLSSLQSHGKKEVCLSAAALSCMHAQLAALGSPWGTLCGAEQGCGPRCAGPFWGACEDVAGSLPGVNETRRGADLAELSQDSYRFMC